MYVSPQLLSVLGSLVLGGAVTLLVWVVKQVNAHAVLMAQMQIVEKNMSDDILELKAWRAALEIHRRAGGRLPFDQDTAEETTT